MMADDHFPDVVLVKEALRCNGVTFQMDVCSDGETAVRYLSDLETQHSKPDLIILDLHLSRIGGLDLLKRIREQPLFDDTPVAMFTSSLSPSKRAQALQLKVDAFLEKPTTLNEFLSGVGPALRNLIEVKNRDRSN
jgi:DNA-binding response OmpR family regulator